jgi:hypothetical protein
MPVPGSQARLPQPSIRHRTRPCAAPRVLAQTSRADLRDHHVEGRRRFGGVKRSSSGHGVRRTALEVSGLLTWFSLSRSTVSITGNPAVAGWRADHELRMTRLPHTRRGLVHRTRPVATSVTIWRRSRVGAANLGEAVMPTDTRTSRSAVRGLRRRSTDDELANMGHRVVVMCRRSARRVERPLGERIVSVVSFTPIATRGVGVAVG